jgi:transposase InsO family protein
LTTIPAWFPKGQFYWNEQLPRLEDCLKRAISRYGRPLAIYADQGAVYRTQQLDAACATLGIQRILPAPAHLRPRARLKGGLGFNHAVARAGEGSDDFS